MPGAGMNEDPDVCQNDPGQDGFRDANNLHRDVARDRFGYALSYYANDYTPDYTPINGKNMMAVDDFHNDIQASDLYNGNIRAAVYDYYPGNDDRFIDQADFGLLGVPRGIGYTYDQLNRLIASNNYLYNGDIFEPAGRHNTSYSYDANGNIKLLERRDNEGDELDVLEYHYDAPASNRLMAVEDRVGPTSHEGDFEGLSEYEYDEIGNLIRDSEADIEAITWTTSGKVHQVHFENGTMNEAGEYHADLEFRYDASGNRVLKIIKPRNGEGYVKEEETCWQRIYYIRDAQGNVMATMEQRPVDNCQPVLEMENFYVYGSERLGKEKSGIPWPDLENGWKDSIFVRMMEEKSYELTNHLGNVHMTLSDYRRKEADGQEVIYYSQINSASDYYPFGQLLTDGNYSSGDYRFGFNSQEKDDEIYGQGNSYSAEFWQYDARLGRRWNVDPMTNEEPGWSPYRAFYDNPIRFIDPTGLLESTHTDEEGNVIAVYDDGDNGVYRHKNEDLKDFDPEKESLTTIGAEKVGETEQWDEFVSPETGKTMTNYKIQFGKSFDPIIERMHEKAEDMNLIEIAKASRGGGLFDIKKDYENVGALLNNKYATSRSAGNFLAGYNAESGRIMGLGISFEKFQKLAGALHIEESNDNTLTKGQMLDIVISGKYQSSNTKRFKAHPKFKAPTWGEVMYQYRMSKAGWKYGEEK